MAYQKQTWVNDVTDVDATHMNHIEDGIEKAYNVELLAVVDTAPSECSEGDKYYNTTTNKIYTATGTNTWGVDGEDAIEGIMYVVFDEQATYSYDGTTMVSVGGGSDEVAISTTQPENDEKIWINPNETPSGIGSYISNTYGESQAIGYSQEYVNEKVDDIYSTSEVKTSKIYIDSNNVKHSIYRKCTTLTNVARGYVEHQFSLSGMTKLIKVEGTFYISDGYNSIQRVVPDAIATAGVGVLNVTTTKFATLLGSSVSTTNSIFVIFEYTKD